MDNNLKLYEPDLNNVQQKLVKSIEDKYKSKYVGLWCVKFANGNWANYPIYVFYQPNPDISKGHSKYFGIFYTEEDWMICNAESAFSKDIIGIVDSDLVYVSRFRHDYISTPNGHVIDGGRDYLIYSKNALDDNKDNGKLVKVIIENGEFKFLPFTEGFQNHVDLLNGIIDFNKPQIESQCIVRLSTNDWHDSYGCYEKKSLRILKSKSFGGIYECVLNDLESTGNILPRIINLNDCQDGLYYIRCVNEKRDWETNYIEDWDYKLIPYEK